MRPSTKRYPLWMHLEHYLRHFPAAVALLRRLVHQERSAPRPPAGARLIAMGAIKGSLTLTDLLCGALSREDRFELYLTREESFFARHLRYSRSFEDVYFVEAKHCIDMAEVDVFFGPRWRTGDRFVVYRKKDVQPSSRQFHQAPLQNSEVAH